MTALRLLTVLVVLALFGATPLAAADADAPFGSVFGSKVNGFT